MKNERFRPHTMTVIDHETFREQQGRLIQEAVVSAENGVHKHYEGGGTVWCNWAEPCDETRSISELLA